jgi:hypothetical protein
MKQWIPAFAGMTGGWKLSAHELQETNKKPESEMIVITPDSGFLLLIIGNRYTATLTIN